jgi:hypothetical protein
MKERMQKVAGHFMVRIVVFFVLLLVSLFCAEGCPEHKDVYEPGGPHHVVMSV